jgi:hypothetical protein
MNRAAALQVYIDQYPKFDWATSNCCQFTGAWVEKIEGFNPMRGLPETLSRFAAWRLIVETGGNLRDALTRRLRREPMLSAFAQTGDVVLVSIDGVETVGLCSGRVAVAVSQDHGVVSVPMENALYAWPIGRPQ